MIYIRCSSMLLQYMDSVLSAYWCQSTRFLIFWTTYKVPASKLFPQSNYYRLDMTTYHICTHSYTLAAILAAELLQHYEPTWTLRSFSSFQLSVPRYNLEFGSRAFRISAPKIWNLLPASIRNSPSLPTFRRHLKTHYFQSAYPNPLMTTPSQRALILYRCRRFINHSLTYLLFRFTSASQQSLRFTGSVGSLQCLPK